MRVLFVCSAGGHLAQLTALRDWWSGHERHWVSFDQPDARSVLAEETVTYAYSPTTRNVPNLLRNVGVARRVMRDFKPDLVVSNGAGVAVPFFYLARLQGVRTVYLEVYDRVDSRTMTARLCRPVTDLFMVQWEQQLALYPEAELVGQVM